MSLVFVYL